MPGQDKNEPIDDIMNGLSTQDDKSDKSENKSQKGAGDPEDTEDDDDEEGEEPETSYRPTGEKKTKKESSSETVPLSVFLELKKDFKELKEQLSGDLTNKDIAEFAQAAGIELDVAKRFVTMIQTKTKEDVLQEVEETVKPIAKSSVAEESLSLFEADFEKSISSKYPELAEKKEIFKKIAFSKEFLHLKTLEDIRKEFYPNSTKVKAKKKDSPEKGSQGANDKAPESVNFATMDDETYRKVLANSDSRAKYYEWLDSQGR